MMAGTGIIPSFFIETFLCLARVFTRLVDIHRLWKDGTGSKAANVGNRAPLHQ